MSIIEFLRLKSAVAEQKAKEVKAEMVTQDGQIAMSAADQEDPFDHPVNPVFPDSLFESTHCHF
ncbi:hypothetical protein [Aquabacterium sp. NJ1]|uniref:hypothetical protein n=1 Tax=Aquabacterium sp. NJ1 TaxID=1538295 RepID=UPI001269CD14|nr:hypothetical protein [Aquabacterium sp. NJ1]